MCESEVSQYCNPHLDETCTMIILLCLKHNNVQCKGCLCMEWILIALQNLRKKILCEVMAIVKKNKCE